jgi:riboflavin biosynthesis pyrimidine reductase
VKARVFLLFVSLLLTLRVPPDYIPVPVILSALRREGIKSLMVEGGARVINSFLAYPTLVRRIIVTVAPVFVGKDGVGYGIQNKVRCSRRSMRRTRD